MAVGEFNSKMGIEVSFLDIYLSLSSRPKIPKGNFGFPKKSGKFSPFLILMAHLITLGFGHFQTLIQKLNHFPFLNS